MAFKGLWSVYTIVVTIVGGILGWQTYLVGMELSSVQEAFEGNVLRALALAGLVIAGALAGFLVSIITFPKLVDVINQIEEVPLIHKVVVMLGVILGLVLGLLGTWPFARIPRIGVPLQMLGCGLGVIIGVGLARSASRQLTRVFPALEDDGSGDAGGGQRQQPKFLDTNVIIDGRIADICGTGFVEGPVMVPGFVLTELQSIADSADNLRRARGRRGLDVLNRMQKELQQPVIVLEDYGDDYDESEAVDIRLVKLARAKKAAVITNDYNLNKVAELHGVPVLNVNELANAMRPVFLPGEELSVTIVKEGNQPKQGVAYLDDGTMVVVEQASKMLGREVDVVVTSILQTVAGQMIFAELKFADGQTVVKKGKNS
ncbi:MAG: PIN/TRAM domain-containing protein [Armatimonadota bacterium]